MHWIALQPDPTLAAGELTDPATALGWWALRYTPKVARIGNAVLLEVSASARLWGGLPALSAHIFISNKPVVLVGYAQGTTSLVAFAQLTTAPSRTMPPWFGHTVDDLPLRALAAASAHLDTLARLGVKTWGQLRWLPRGGVARRFGAPLLDALDQAYGQRPDVYPWLVLPEVFEASLELTSQVESAPALLFAARRLLAQLQVWLQLRHRGVLALVLVWQMDERRHTEHQGELLLRTAQPTQDSAHLQRLLSEHLAHVRLSAPAHTLQLRTVQTAALADTSASLLVDATRTGDSLVQMVERLSARLGLSKVLQLQPHLDHRPEHMQVWHHAAINILAISAYGVSTRGQKHVTKAACLTDGTCAHWAQALYPSWLLEAPLPLLVRQQHPQYQGPLALLAGPQRLETGWWGGGECALRDYFVARSAQSGLLWVYRERLGSPSGPGEVNGQDHADAHPAKWYLHGFFA